MLAGQLQDTDHPENIVFRSNAHRLHGLFIRVIFENLSNDELW